MRSCDPFTKHPVIMAALNVGTDQEKTLRLGQARVQAALPFGFITKQIK